jgi:hypothetical protein
MLLRRAFVPKNSELSILSLVFDYFQKNDIGNALAMMCAREWSSHLSPVMASLIQKTREQRVQLTARVYTAVRLKDLAQQLCMDESECAKSGCFLFYCMYTIVTWSVCLCVLFCLVLQCVRGWGGPSKVHSCCQRRPPQNGWPPQVADRHDNAALHIFIVCWDSSCLFLAVAASLAVSVCVCVWFAWQCRTWSC